ncbi:MAG TPA: hypothetical protein VLB68_19785 [Pyrinomonadaceae bacterium]|nr:hypothetical protein [Pyrinomonadaceae bacterium]
MSDNLYQLVGVAQPNPGDKLKHVAQNDGHLPNEGFDGDWKRRVNSQCNPVLWCAPLSGAFYGRKS